MASILRKRLHLLSLSSSCWLTFSIRRSVQACTDVTTWRRARKGDSRRLLGVASNNKKCGYSKTSYQHLWKIRVSHLNLGRSTVRTTTSKLRQQSGKIHVFDPFGEASSTKKKNSYLWPKDFLLMVANSPFWSPEPPCSNVCKLPTCLCILYPWGWWSKTELRLRQETAEVYPQGQPSLPFMLCFQSCYLNLIGILFLPMETLNNVIRSLIFSYLFHVSPVALSNEHEFLKLIWCWSFPTFSDLPSSKLT